VPECVGTEMGRSAWYVVNGDNILFRVDVLIWRIEAGIFPAKLDS